MTSEEQLFDKPKLQEEEQVPKVQEKPKKKKAKKPLSPNSKKKLIERLKAGKLKKAQLKANKQTPEKTESNINKEPEPTKQPIQNHEPKEQKPLENKQKTVSKKEKVNEPPIPIFNVTNNDFNELKNELKSLKELLRTNKQKNLSSNNKETTLQDVKPKENSSSIKEPLSKQTLKNETIIIKQPIQQKRRKVKKFR